MTPSSDFRNKDDNPNSHDASRHVGCRLLTTARAHLMLHDVLKPLQGGAHGCKLLSIPTLDKALHLPQQGTSGALPQSVGASGLTDLHM